MADENRRMNDYTASDINDNIAEVREARGSYDSLDDRLDNIAGIGEWTTYSDQLSTSLANVDTENSSLNVYVNTSLRRVVCVLTVKFSTAWAGGSATKIGEIPLADYAPIGSVRAYAHTASYTFGMIKSSGVKSLNINVYDGEIPANTTVNAQIEWTY